MANFTYPVLPFGTTTFTSPVAGTSDVITSSGLANFTINGNGGNDVVRTASGDDTITTGSGNDVITAAEGNNTVTAGDGTNAVTTGSGNDTITTGSGNDRINAGGGNDKVNAGTGDDRITPGGGIDSLIGGGGHDTFVYGSLADARLGADTIADFSTARPTSAGEGDMLNLRGLVDDFTSLRGGDQSLAKLVASGHLDFSAGGGGTVIKFDSNGSAAGGSTGVLVTLVGVPFTTEGAAVLAFADNIVVGG